MSTKKIWRDLFYETYGEKGYSQDEIEMLYMCDMELQAYFDYGEIIPESLKLQKIKYGMKVNSEKSDITGNLIQIKRSAHSVAR